MTLQRTTEGRTGTHGYTRESARPFAVATLRAMFEAYPPAEQARVKARVIAQLRSELANPAFHAAHAHGQRGGSELWRLAGDVYGVTARDVERG